MHDVSSMQKARQFTAVVSMLVRFPNPLYQVRWVTCLVHACSVSLSLCLPLHRHNFYLMDMKDSVMRSYFWKLNLNTDFSRLLHIYQAIRNLRFISSTIQLKTTPPSLNNLELLSMPFATLINFEIMVKYLWN